MSLEGHDSFDTGICEAGIANKQFMCLNCTQDSAPLACACACMCMCVKIVAKHNCSGPLIDLHFFSVCLLKHCSLHIINLGLLGVCNGSVLRLRWTSYDLKCVSMFPIIQHNWSLSKGNAPGDGIFRRHFRWISGTSEYSLYPVQCLATNSQSSLIPKEL